ncbi:MAG: slipin family protein [Anaerolineae bacterium]|jgi:regulator of protease activity HflC (stomatin/prohibitin superfamily)
MIQTIAIIGAIAVAFILLVALPAVRIVQQWERGVVLRFGRLISLREPGLNLILPWIDRMVKVDLRVETLVLEPQEVITRDNVTVHVDAVVYFKVIDAKKAVIEVRNYQKATTQIALTTLRSVLGQSELDELLAHRDRINNRLQEIIDEHTEEPWGVLVVTVEVKDVQLPERLQRAMARQAESEREKRAKIIHAEGEYAAAEKLVKAGEAMAGQPVSLQLRYLQTLLEMAGEQNSTIIPVPVDIVSTLLPKARGNDQGK